MWLKRDLKNAHKDLHFLPIFFWVASSLSTQIDRIFLKFASTPPPIRMRSKLGGDCSCLQKLMSGLCSRWLHFYSCIPIPQLLLCPLRFYIKCLKHLFIFWDYFNYISVSCLYFTTRAIWQCNKIFKIYMTIYKNVRNVHSKRPIDQAMI